jgi:hypothetical protein
MYIHTVIHEVTWGVRPPSFEEYSVMPVENRTRASARPALGGARRRPERVCTVLYRIPKARLHGTANREMRQKSGKSTGLRQESPWHPVSRKAVTQSGKHCRAGLSSMLSCSLLMTPEAAPEPAVQPWRASAVFPVVPENTLLGWTCDKEEMQHCRGHDRLPCGP